MLPRFPTAQKIADEEFGKRLFAAESEIFPRGIQPPIHVITEGRNSDYQREDGAVIPLDIKRQQVSLAFSIKDGKGLTLNEFFQQARELGEGLGRRMWKLLAEAIDNVVNETGNKIEMTKGSLQKEDILKILEMGAPSFDEKGQADSFLVLEPSVFEEFKKCEAEWAKDTEFVAKVEEINRRKKEEFNEREARRRLVD